MFNKIIFNYVRKYRHATLPKGAIFIIDMIIFFAVFCVTELFESKADVWQQTEVLIRLITTTVVTILCMLAASTHKIIIRYFGLNDILRIFVACASAFAIFFVINLINNYAILNIQHGFLPSYREILEIYTLLGVFMILFRFFLQCVFNKYFKKRRPRTNVVIYGAGAAGIITQNALLQDLRNEYHIVAFIDDDQSKINQSLNGVPILSNKEVLNHHFVSDKKVSQLIVALPKVRVIHKKAITNRALSLGLNVKSVPHINTWINGGFTSNQIEDIKIEDLLERESIKLDNANVIREVRGKVVMVTGAAGSIGSEICRQLIQYQPERIIMLDQAESPMYDLQFELKNNEPYKGWVEHMVFVIANVKDQRRMEEVFSTYKPQIIYHAAAYKHVPFMEENPYEAIYVNVFGTKNLANLAIQYGAEKFVMISTDKAVNPTNVMGATKRMAEIYTQSRTAKTKFVTTRFGNVLGSNGSVIPLFKKQLAAGGPLTVTHKDIIRYFMTIPEACSLVLEAGAMGEGGDIFVFDMGKPVKIYTLAEKMIQLSGKTGIEIKEIGLRPGEKLYEELLATKENTIPTYHPKIMHALVRKYPVEEVDKAYDELWDILATLDDMKIVGKMKQIVPEFKSNNSIYCPLDK